MDYSVGDLLAHNSKRHYPTKAKAKKVLLQLKSKPKNGIRKKLYVRSVYKCKVCGLWCLTSMRKNDQY